MITKRAALSIVLAAIMVGSVTAVAAPSILAQDNGNGGQSAEAICSEQGLPPLGKIEGTDDIDESGETVTFDGTTIEFTDQQFKEGGSEMYGFDFQVTSGSNVGFVRIKGGGGNDGPESVNTYDYTPDGVTSGDDLSTTINDNNDQPYEISNVVFCGVNEQTTQEPTTQEPTTQEPTTQEPTTTEPTTTQPTTQEPTTTQPTTQQPTTTKPTTTKPTTTKPTTQEPTTTKPTTTKPTTQEPTTTKPTTQEPTTTKPTTQEPTTQQPKTEQPTEAPPTEAPTEQPTEQPETEAPPSVAFYQVDFVVGEPKPELGPEAGFYSDENRLITFAHGNSEDGLTRTESSTPSSDVGSCLDVAHVGQVEDGQATVTFTVEEDCELTLSLASYEKADGSFDRDEVQRLFDGTTDTYGPGTYTVTVDLPPEETSDASALGATFDGLQPVLALFVSAGLGFALVARRD
ncbi:hypothetical protein [Halomarina rubra]|uniref:Uncharacterized protein n=1 Tax=Halomarina rubra TaxID=2071873 RepID=A0ABD6AQP8_9EURY|nr:hypothetical protein [Halomarina rubra]